MGRKRRIAEVPGTPLAGSLLGQPVVATLDLHGRTAAEAERLVRDFILTSTRGASGQVVRIVTGKGTGSAGKPVLLPLVRQWLENRPRPLRGHRVARHRRRQLPGANAVK